MSEDTHPQEASSTFPLEIAIALVAAGLSWLAVPASGIVMHWDADDVAGWSMSADIYAAVAAVATFLLGRFVTQLVTAKSGFSYWWIAPVAAGVLMSGYPAAVRVAPGVTSVVAAAALAIAVYFTLLWIALRRGANERRSGPESDAGTGPLSS